MRVKCALVPRRLELGEKDGIPAESLLGSEQAAFSAHNFVLRTSCGRRCAGKQALEQGACSEPK